MLHMPSPMLMGPEAGLTYEAFEAHIIAKATDGPVAWASDFAGSGLPSKRTTVANSAFAGDMPGTTWGNGEAARGYAWANTPTCRAIQHALPSQAEGLAQIAASRRIYFEIVDNTSSGPLFALDRNGFLSSYYGSELSAARIALVLYWDGEKPMKTEPRYGIGPSPYTWSA